VEITSFGDQSEWEKLNLMDSCRHILSLIKKNHSVSIEKIYFESKEWLKKDIFIEWKINISGMTHLEIMEEIENVVKKSIKQRKENQIWDHDSSIWPKFQRTSDKIYTLKDLCDAISRDDLDFVQKVRNDGFYNRFLVGKTWDPAEILGNTNLFENVPKDDFGEYDIYDNALIVCAKNNSLHCLMYLLENGANPNYQNKKFQTALHICALNDYFDCAFHLLKFEAKKTIIDIYGLNAYQWAVKNNSSVCIGMLK